MRVSIVDVFAEAKLAGNQLAVVHDAAHLSEQQMQAIALEMNFSETTFVIDHSDDRATVRIFTPTWELPFAGHPTLGTAWVLTGGEGTITLDLKAGPVPVEFEQGTGWMVPPTVKFHGDIEPDLAADLLGLDTAAIASDMPLEFAEVGPKFALIPVRDLASLRAAKLNAELHASLRAQEVPAQCVFVFTAEPYAPTADFASRMFFESNGVREDPATGSANSAFAAYLRRHSLASGRVVVDQGVEIGRPSRIYLAVGDTLQVGGKVQPVLSGELDL